MGLPGRSWGSPGAPGALWGASWGLQNRSREASRTPAEPGAQLGDLIFAKKRPRSKHSSFLAPEINLAIMEREARQTRERASNASKARAERAARTARAGATRQGTEARREWREPPEDRNSKPVRSPTPLLGRFAAYAGGLRWESVSVTSFLCRHQK